MSTVRRVVGYGRREDVVQELRRAIMLGELRPGEHLREVGLAAALGVSRPTVREAIRQLVHEGMLDAEPYKGVRVVDVGDEALMKTAQLRTVIETFASHEAALHFGPLTQRRFQEMLSRLRVAGMNGDAQDLHEAHLALHKLIIETAQVPYLERIWAVLEGPIAMTMRADREAFPEIDRFISRHDRLVATLTAGDPAAIEAEVATHVERNAAEVVSARARADTPERRARQLSAPEDVGAAVERPPRP